MKALSEAIALIAGEVHPEAVEKLCAALATNPNEEPFGLIKSHLGSAFSPLKLERLRAALNKCPGTTTAEISAMFQGSAKTAELLNQMRSIEMVWTGPSTNFVPIRHTEQVLTGLIDEAEESIFLVSFVAYNVVSVVAALQRAISRRVIVRFLLERSKQHGGSVNFDSIEILRRGLPQALYFEWDKEANGAVQSSSVHAKCAVADSKVAFITSANLTEAAMDRNMELGILVRGGEAPSLLQRHLMALITTRQLRLI